MHVLSEFFFYFVAVDAVIALRGMLVNYLHRGKYLNIIARSQETYRKFTAG